MGRKRNLILVFSVLCVLTVIVVWIPFHWHGKNTRPKSLAADQHGSRAVDQVHTPALDVESIVQHGHIVEIVASTVMINGEKAAVVFEGSGLKHFVGPLPDGVTMITITVQNDSGGVNTRELSVVLP
jgi:hypothetical protein